MYPAGRKIITNIWTRISHPSQVKNNQTFNRNDCFFSSECLLFPMFVFSSSAEAAVLLYSENTGTCFSFLFLTEEHCIEGGADFTYQSFFQGRIFQRCHTQRTIPPLDWFSFMYFAVRNISSSFTVMIFFSFQTSK